MSAALGLYCDGCGIKFPVSFPPYSMTRARRAAREIQNGSRGEVWTVSRRWRFGAPGGRDFCPRCWGDEWRKTHPNK